MISPRRHQVNGADPEHPPPAQLADEFAQTPVGGRGDVVGRGFLDRVALGVVRYDVAGDVVSALDRAAHVGQRVDTPLQASLEFADTLLEAGDVAGLAAPDLFCQYVVVDDFAIGSCQVQKNLHDLRTESLDPIGTADLAAERAHVVIPEPEAVAKQASIVVVLRFSGHGGMIIHRGLFHYDTADRRKSHPHGDMTWPGRSPSSRLRRNWPDAQWDAGSAAS